MALDFFISPEFLKSVKLDGNTETLMRIIIQKKGSVCCHDSRIKETGGLHLRHVKAFNTEFQKAKID